MAAVLTSFPLVSDFLAHLKVGKYPLSCPLQGWANLWLTLPSPLGSLEAGQPRTTTRPEAITLARHRGGNVRDACHERATTAAGNFRLLPPHRLGRIHLRPPRGERRQARGAAAQWRPHHHRHARPHPRLHVVPSGAWRAARPHL